MVQKYLGLRHQYGVIDCIELIRLLYTDELSLEFPLPTYVKSRAWMKQFTTENVDEWALKAFVKVELTDARDYDVMSFKSTKTNHIIHFGLFLKPTKLLHIEEGGVSCVETLSEYWMNRLCTVYRHEKMV